MAGRNILWQDRPSTFEMAPFQGLTLWQDSVNVGVRGRGHPIATQPGEAAQKEGCQKAMGHIDDKGRKRLTGESRPQSLAEWRSLFQARNGRGNPFPYLYGQGLIELRDSWGNPVGSLVDWGERQRITDPYTLCWCWPWDVTPDGYPRAWAPKDKVRATLHQLIYKAWRGLPHDDKSAPRLVTTCGDSTCINPHHITTRAAFHQMQRSFTYLDHAMRIGRRPQRPERDWTEEQIADWRAHNPEDAAEYDRFFAEEGRSE